MTHHFPEPAVQPDDTSPSITMRPVELSQRPANSGRIFGLASLIGTAVFMLGTVALLLFPASTPAPTPGMPPTLAETTAVAVAVTATEVIPASPTESPDIPTTENPAPTTAAQALSAEQLQVLLQTPIAGREQIAERINYAPFTIINSDRPRSDFVEYTVVRGDIIDDIARRFNINADSIAWCNDRRIVFVLRVGDVLRIPPIDGACHTVLGSRQESIAAIAEQYQVNPLDIIDYPLNNLYGRDVNDILPGGLNLFIPGGQGEPVTWNPGYEPELDSNGNVVGVRFGPGEAGSCGIVSPGSFVGWGNPLPSGRWIRGFYAGHTGIDLSAPFGTPIYAASTGPVLFSGFSQWGYGETVVLAHGPYTTLYAHMSQRNAQCGDMFSIGMVVGMVGSTGNSSGPHLHFEIRLNNEPQDPSGTPGIGW